jgi:hypothetical protein
MSREVSDLRNNYRPPQSTAKGQTPWMEAVTVTDRRNSREEMLRNIPTFDGHLVAGILGIHPIPQLT